MPYNGVYDQECTLTIQRMSVIGEKAPRLRGFAMKGVYAINDSDNSVGGTLRNSIR
jgi:hypothetical protein